MIRVTIAGERALPETGFGHPPLNDLLNTHRWSENPRQFTQNGKTIILRQCARCRRDFALGLDGASWNAVHLGVFKVVVLAEDVNDRWLHEPCPEERSPLDDVDRGRSRRFPG